LIAAPGGIFHPAGAAGVPDPSLDTEATGLSAQHAPRQPARSFVHLTKRAEFLRANKGRRFHATAFSMLAFRRPEPDASAAARFGFTVTKKIGGAVERNRIRRRLREAIRVAPDLASQHGYDYVLVARREALAAPFSSLMHDLDRALRGIHDGRPRPAKRAVRGAPEQREPAEGEPRPQTAREDRAPRS